jgi:hypothetical protein
MSQAEYRLDKFFEEQGSSSAWVRNPSHHVQLAVCVTDVEVIDFISFCYRAPVSIFFGPQY